MQRELGLLGCAFAGLVIGAAAAGTAVLGAGAAQNAAIGFESKWLTSGRWLTAPMIKAFAQMSDDILTLSTQLPMAAEGIAEIVGGGQQAGIASRRFDAVCERRSENGGGAFDTTAEESGQMMAQWRTAFRLTQEDVGCPGR